MFRIYRRKGEGDVRIEVAIAVDEENEGEQGVEDDSEGLAQSSAWKEDKSDTMGQCDGLNQLVQTLAYIDQRHSKLYALQLIQPLALDDPF